MLHALAHLFRMNRGRVYSWTDSVSGAHMIGFRCDGCGDYDMIYGHQGLIERNGGQKAYRFAHRFGYTPETLTDSFAKAGFQRVNAKASGFDAMCVGYK